MASPYVVLGVGPNADGDAIARAYRERVLETHPDQGGSAADFLRVKAAYEALSSGEWDAGDEFEPETVESPERVVATEVEYLNYEVLEDHGWALEEDELFERAAGASLDPRDYGRFLVQHGETLLEAAENRGFTWPYACRGGACANCAIAVCGGELAMPVDHILPEAMMDRRIRLSCNAVPTTDELQVVYNVKHRPDLDELRLPPHRFERDHPDFEH